MKRRAILAAAAAAAFAVIGVDARAPGAGVAAAGVHSLEYEVALPGGPVEYHFQVAAQDEDGARAAVQAAIRQLAPDAVARELHELREGSVSAAFAFWPWQWTDEELPVAVWYNPAGAPADTPDGRVTDGLRPWSEVATSRFAFTLAGATDAAPLLHERTFDGRNVIGWKDLDCAKGCVLGLTSKVRDTHEVDIVLNSNPLARLGDGTGSTADITTVVMHEAGHMAGLEHSCPPAGGECTAAAREAAMYYRYQGTMGGLQADDIAGISALYPGRRQVVDSADAPRPAPKPTLHLAIRVDDGWNLIVLPAGPLEETMGALACVKAVYAFEPGGWVTWLRDVPPFLNTLAAADGERAYWVEARGACSAALG